VVKGNALYDKFAKNNRIDQAIYESKKLIPFNVTAPGG
jgi:hypothetical protein